MLLKQAREITDGTEMQALIDRALPEDDIEASAMCFGRRLPANYLLTDHTI